MPLTRNRFGPSGPFGDPDGGTNNNGVPLAIMRCETPSNITLTDASGPVSAEFTPNFGEIQVPADTPASDIGYVLDVQCRFINRKGGTTTNPRVDYTVEVWNDTAGVWLGAGSAIDVWGTPEKEQGAMVVGNPSTGITAGTYTKARLTMAANAGNAALNELAGLLAADNPTIEVALYLGKG